MSKIIVLVLCLLVLVFLVNAVVVSGQASCTPSGEQAKPPMECTPTNCGAKECADIHKRGVEQAVETCISTSQSCQPQGSICEAATTALQQGLQTALEVATSFVTKLIGGGVFTSVGCGEMNHCMLESVKKGGLKSFEVINGCGSQIDKTTHDKLLARYEDQAAKNFNLNSPNAIESIKTYQFKTPDGYQTIQQQLSTTNKELMNEIANNQKWSFSAEESVKQINSKLGVELSFFNQIGVTSIVLKNNPYIQAGGIGVGVGSFGKEIYDLFIAEDEEEQVTYTQNIYYGAQNDINNAQNSQAQGTSKWTNCPGHRDGRCSGKAVCVTDSNSGASQCIAALPGQHVTVRFGSIHIIDTQQNNMFTLTSSENEGIVYQQDGFVNIDKGGITKISVAGQGAVITDANKNQLYLGRGTTTYLGIGSESSETYLTNTFIFNPKSSVAVAAVNPSEQERLRESRAININRDEKLSLTFDKQKLNLYMNGVDISGFAGNYLILTRGFSNIKIVERDKSFPLASRNNAKGDSLIVKNKDVAISKGYNVNDGTYNYIIKTTGFSTKVFAENGKILEDSSPMSNGVSPRQEILLYKNTFT